MDKELFNLWTSRYKRIIAIVIVLLCVFMSILHNEVNAINTDKNGVTINEKISSEKSLRLLQKSKKKKNSHKLETAILIVGGVVLAAVVVTTAILIAREIYHSMKSVNSGSMSGAKISAKSGNTDPIADSVIDAKVRPEQTAQVPTADSVIGGKISLDKAMKDPDPTGIIRAIYPDFPPLTPEQLEFFQSLPPKEQNKIRQYCLQQLSFIPSSDLTVDLSIKNPKLDGAITKSVQPDQAHDGLEKINTIFYAHDSVGKSFRCDGDHEINRELLNASYIPESQSKEEQERTKRQIMEEKIVIINSGTLESIPQLYNRNIILPDSKVGALSYGNYGKGGGAVAIGGRAQEEYVCEGSDAYNRLMDVRTILHFYLNNRAALNSTENGPAGTRILSCDNVRVFQNDQIYPINLITASAPHIGFPDGNGFTINVGDRNHIKRLDSLLRGIINTSYVCKDNVLVLGAIGCGVFRNTPELVATAMKQILIDQGQAGLFNKVVIAIPYSNSKNYKAFRNIFGNAQEININP